MKLELFRKLSGFNVSQYYSVCVFHSLCGIASNKTNNCWKKIFHKLLSWLVKGLKTKHILDNFYLSSEVINVHFKQLTSLQVTLFFTEVSFAYDSLYVLIVKYILWILNFD